MTLLATFIVGLAAAVLCMSIVFLIGWRLARFDIVDVAWGLTFIVVCFVSLAMNQINLTSVIAFCLVGAWGVRLSSHIYRRFRATAHEDRRYVELREKWRSGNIAAAIYTRIYVVQAVLASAVCMPILVIHAAQVEALPVYLIIGAAVWLTGFIFEVVGDRQLEVFIRRSENKGRLMTRGLWRYSRHPNYFGELVQWWGVGVIALGVPYGWIGLVGPALLTYLIVFVSGVPPVERAFDGRPGWAEYRAGTSMLIPLPTRKVARKG